MDRCLDDRDVAAFVDGELSGESVAWVDRHIDRCDACRVHLAEVARAPVLRSFLAGELTTATPDLHERPDIAATEPAPETPAARPRPPRLDGGVPPAGAQLGRYVVDEVIGRGGMGVVLRAHDPVLDRTVAIKLVRPVDSSAMATSGEWRRRLRLEGQAMARLRHPNVVAVHDAGSYGDQLFVAMELIDGVSLSQWLATERSWRDALAVCIAAGRGLAAAHAAGIIHGDVKPDNILIGGDGRVLIGDFGLATAAPNDDGAAGEAAPAAAGSTGGEVSSGLRIAGTPVYMAPELFAGAPADEMSDQFSFCVTLYHAVYRRLPWRSRTFDELREEVEAGKLERPDAPATPSWLWRAISRGMSAAVRDRHRSMDALLDHLERAAGRRRRIAAATTGVVVLAAVAIAGGAVARRAQGDPPRHAGDDSAGASRAAAPAIAVARVERVTFEQGCESRPVFWPDGSAVLYDVAVEGADQVMRLDLATGQRTPVTSAPGEHIIAGVSPDGRWISYVSLSARGHKLTLAPWEDGRPGAAQAVAPAGGIPSWSRSGQLLYGSEDRGGIYAVTPTKQAIAAVRIAETQPNLMPVYLAPLADGRIVYGARLQGPLESSLEVGWVRPGSPPVAIGTASTEFPLLGLVPDATGGGFYVGQPTPAGDRLHWRSMRPGVGPEVAVELAPFPYGGMDVAKSGDRLVFSTCRRLQRVGRFRPGGTFEPLAGPRDWSDADLVPMGQGRFLFVSTRSGDARVWLLEGTAAPRIVLDRAAAEPALSPNGQTLAWVGRDEGAGGLYARDDLDAPVRRLTTDPSDQRPQFSADGESVLFMRARPEGVRLMRAPAAGGEAEVVVRDEVLAFAVSPSDGQLAWVAAAKKGWVLRVGRPGQPAHNVPGLPPGVYTFVQYARDGSRLAVVRDQKELIEVSLASPATPATVWHSGRDYIYQVAADPDGRGWLGSLATYDGDLHIAHGRFH